jgi:hypothetical protein
MKTLLATSILAIALPVSAASLSVTPAAPAPSDTLVLEVTGAAPCASLVPFPVQMVDGVIRVTYNDGANITCVAAMPPLKTAIGRLPAGRYRVELVPFFPAGGPVQATTTIEVAVPSGTTPPYDDYSGHYLTGTDGEGVFVTQSGMTAFISFLYVRPDGASTWAVMPNARWGLDSNGGLRFFGEIWRIEPSGSASGAGRLHSMIGFGSFYPSGIFDRARVETHIPEMQARSLTRFRF